MAIEHVWARIGESLWVSLDAIKVDGIRDIFTPAELRAVAAEIGGGARLPTCAELDARWLAAGLHNIPHPNVEWLSEVGDTDGIPDHHHHSAAVDADLEDHLERYGEPYLWIVGNAGKHWVASQNDPEVEGFFTDPQGDDPLYGWYYDEHTKHLAAGIPIHNPETPDMHGKHWVIQRPIDSSHKHHEDYSMTGVLATNEEPDEWVEIGEDGTVITVRRIRTTPPPADSTILPPDTLPSSPPWLDPELEHGERKVLWLIEQRELGVCEKPNGSNNGPEISTYHEATIRDGQPGYGKWLAKAGGNWCASSAWAAHMRTRLETDAGPIGIPRSSGIETETDAKADGTWRPIELVLRGEYEPAVGDIGTIQRGQPGSWKRHVFTITRNVPERKGCMTIGGNEGNRFGPETFRKWASMLGMRDCLHTFEGEVPYQGEDVDIEMPALVVTPTGNPLDGDGDNALEPGWAPMDPDPWIPEEWRGVEGCARRWRTTKGGIAVKGEPGPRRTKGKPITVGKVWAAYRDAIEEAHELTDVPLVTLLAMLTTEAKTNAKAERYEKHLNDWSFGAAQTLTSTAWAMARQLHITPPRKPFPLDESTENDWRDFLFEPRNAILCGAAYLAYNDERWNLLTDPVLAYAAYNAGSPRVDLALPWGVHYFARESYDALDVFAAWYGDALAVLG